MELRSHNKRLCLTCSTSESLFQAQSTRKAKWVFRETKGKGIPLFMKLHPSDINQSPSNATLRVTSYVPQSLVAGRLSTISRKVLYWASTPPRALNCNIITAPKAYGKTFRNHGIATVRRDGKICLDIETPQPYTEEGRVFPAHVHIVFTSKSEKYKKWDRKKMFVIAAFPGKYTNDSHSVTRISERLRPGAMCSILLPNEVRQHRSNKLILINALPESSSEKRDISKSSLRVPYNLKKDADIRTLVRKKIGTCPYVVYCAHSKCSAASILIKRLVAAGAVNAYYMPAGIQGWHS